MNVRCAIETFSRYSTQEKTDFLLKFAHTLTILARDTYGEEDLTNPSRLRLIEVQYRVISFLMALIKNEEKRYPDEKFVRIILEHPKESDLQQKLEEAFDHLEARAAPTPEVAAHCVPGTFARGRLRQLLWYAGYPFRWFNTLRAIETFSRYSPQKRLTFCYIFRIR